MLLGTEQEYGIVGVDERSRLRTPMVLSDMVVRAYVDAAIEAGVGFDYAGESPLTDAWGEQLARASAAWDLRTDEHCAANRMLSNGARMYVDHAHPELSGPECATWREALLQELAGDAIMASAASRLAKQGHEVALYKNNTDGKGHSYGSHENYLLPRSLDFNAVVAGFVPFLTSRSVISGAGRVGIGPTGQEPGFQISQRADFFERLVGLETTVRRPLVNTRDEPLAERTRWRRLHVITGDGCLSQVACWLKVATASIALELICRGSAPTLELADPVAAFHIFSHDPTLHATVRTVDGRRVTAINIQQAYLEAAQTALTHDPLSPEEDTDVLEAWAETLDLLASDPMACADRLDWVAKLRLLEGLRERDGLSWDDARLAALDLQWGRLGERNVVAALERRGAMITLVDTEDICRAMSTPPSGTRAQVRGALLRRYGNRVVSMGWDRARIIDDLGNHVSLLLEDPFESRTPSL